MPKKQNLLTVNGELNLSNPEVIEHLAGISVTEPPKGMKDIPMRTEEEQTEAELQEREIKEIESLPDKVSIQLAKEQVALLQREARTLKTTWQQHLHNLIQEKIFAKAVGRSIVSAPRIGGGKVTAPSYKVNTLSANAAAQEKNN